MTDRIFFDTNIVVYLFDTSEKEKQLKAERLLLEPMGKFSFYISSQVINEFVNITTGKIKNPVTFERQIEIISFFQAFFFISSISVKTSIAAIELKLKYKFSYWDSLILAAALENKCSILYSEDMQHNQVIENTLKIINPFS